MRISFQLFLEVLNYLLFSVNFVVQRDPSRALLSVFFPQIHIVEQPEQMLEIL